MVKIKQAHLKQLEKQINKNKHAVICGALIGYTADGDTIIDSLLELENEQAEKRDSRYLITPQQYLKAEEAAKAADLELVGFYYSAKGKYEPGGYDLKHAFPGFLYLVVSQDQQPQGVITWAINEKRKNFTEHAIEIINTDENILSHKMAIAV